MTFDINLLLNEIDSNLETNDSITMLEQSSDLQYQEKEVDLIQFPPEMVEN